ncbi:MAG: recombinase family protein [Acidobacteria bacterium]|nr:recombinase family protein [Acidobacteriota bacterium]
MTVALYARYSSDNQRDASIADQVRICRAYAEREGWTIADEFHDHAISGATLLRPGFQALMRRALNREFNIVLAESLDRFSRDQEDTAGLFKRLTFLGVRIVTLAEGEITHLHVGLKGTMNALFLKDLADKTRRGLRGRVEAGKSGGGLCYGYRVIRSLSGTTLTTGEREIEPAEAAIVERVFREFVGGASSKQIAKRLNQEGISGPAGARWNPSTIHGHASRGTGILNNELYVGRIVWNRLRYIKNPDTGLRVSRLNPRSEWITKEVPELRIVSDELWVAAKQRQEATRRVLASSTSIVKARRPQYLFSGLTRCGVCGSGFVLKSRNRLSCFGASDKGICTNHLTVRRDEVESRVLHALQEKLLRRDLFGEFCKEFTQEMNRLRMAARAGITATEHELTRVEAEIKKLIQSIKDGVPGSVLKDEAIRLEAQKSELRTRLDRAAEPPPLLHPNMGDLYREKVTQLAHGLQHEESRTQAAEALRGLIDAIVLNPEGETLGIELQGNLAAMLKAAEAQKTGAPLPPLGNWNETRSPDDDDLVQIMLVAGAGFEPATFGL